MRRRALVVCLAALCVLAGCNALAPGGSGEGRTAPSVTPAAVPDGTAGDVLAPGLTEASVDAEALFAAHSAVLANESVTVEERHRRTVDRAVTHESATTTRYGPARRVAHVEGRVFESALSPYDRESRWANGSVVYVRSVGDGVTAYDRQRPPDGGAATPSFEARENDLRRVLGALRVDGVERLAGGGRERYLVEATVPEGGDRCAAGADDPVPATVRLLVDDRGLVRAVEETSVRCRERGQRSHNGTVVRTTRYTAVGETAVGRPDWVVDARERIADRKYVAPGVTTERVVDAYALQRAHERALANTTFRGAAERVAVR
jgi:hypothetical protein